ncbi:hypothetical protein EDB81DRAFT_891346 [Dactylonectria macrodidyma]|uniref:NAD-dependent epimerase/dehydratase domain-containing protein n=1 Tax=Dactylonectria macrodidyma TaxID=307937 RepID=A0A9P9DL15_9HYPO|nr:hypothetical protein EDB81DRAFT_891346 [Dactylonectria macrodidyma]
MASAQTILVTGANGYVILHVIKSLLGQGYNYWGTQLETAFVTDVTKPESYRDALDETIAGVIHAASPVHGDAQDNVRDMLGPAIKGATAILDAIS